MATARNPGERAALLALLDRLDELDPKCLPDVIAGQWVVADPEARRTIEERIDGLPRRKKKPA